MILGAALNSQLFIANTAIAFMPTSALLKETNFPYIFRDGDAEWRAAESFLLWVEDLYIDYDRSFPPKSEDAPIINESLDEKDEILFAEIDPDSEESWSRYLVESSGKYGFWKVIVRRDRKTLKSQNLKIYSFETIDGDWKGFCQYLTKCIGDKKPFVDSLQ